MQPLQPIVIAGYKLGMQRDKKPFLLPDEAFPVLENAYVWRDRVKKREAKKLVGRLRRDLTAVAQANTDGTGTYIDTDLISALRATEPNAALVPGTVVVTIDPGGANETIYKDIDGLGAVTPGILNFVSGPYTIDWADVNYATARIEINFTAPGTPGAGVAVEADYGYYPSLPVMGIFERDISAINAEQTIFFDTKYAYADTGGVLTELLTGTSWAGTDSDFFWCCNYRGITADVRIFFATNFLCTAANPMRYYNGAWNAFSPLVAAADTLFQARILLPYYGRLIALNTFEGATGGGYAGATNFFNRCRFSAVGDPTAATAWRSDQFGQGGFIDAPTNEAIVSAGFIKNTLIVEFERSTWELRYVGEYGLPFIWERISADLGSESTNSVVTFDGGLLTVGDRGIISADATGIKRIDEAIPDLIFDFRNADNGVKRVIGVRDYQKEVVYWCYSDAQLQRKFPNKVLVYNYRNNTWAIFRDNITFFGVYQPATGVTWDSTTVLWENEEVTWDDPDSQTLFPFTVSGNQQGFIHFYAYSTIEDQSQQVTAMDITVTPIVVTSPDHNFFTGDIISFTDLLFIDTATHIAAATNLNGRTFRVLRLTDNTFSIQEWNTVQQVYINDFTFTPDPADATYYGNGRIIHYPRMDIETKDFNPYLPQGNQFKMSYIDFLVDSTPAAAMSVVLYMNNSPAAVGNLLVGNIKVATYETLPFYVPASGIAWHRFFATCQGQFVRIRMTFDDDLMNDFNNLNSTWVLNAMTLWVRPGSRNAF